ncbi:MAG: hydroxyacylglutathione hydrolase [Rhodomicrobium sp.]
MSTIEIRQFPCRSDNYGILIHDGSAGVTAAIDAPDEDAVRKALRDAGWALTHIFTTHSHFDHVAGHQALKRETNCTIYGPAKEARDIPCIDIPVAEGEKLTFGSIEVQVLETPGHTPGHVTYFLPNAVDVPGSGRKSGVAFAGDTLFSVGCGRVIEGRHAEMWRSLQKIMALPPDTLIYCGHEYTQANIRFALTAEPENPALLDRKRKVDALRSRGEPTLPVTLATELETNPFLRAKSPAIRKSLVLGPDVPDSKVFEELRRRKDRF